MVGTFRSASLEVDLAAVRSNLVEIRRLAGEREVIASIKANAYGFGVIDVSRALVASGVQKLWTGSLAEAIALRTAGIDADILLFGGSEARWSEAIVRYDLQPTIFDSLGLKAMAQAGSVANRRVPVWIKVDAGLGRFGVPLEEALAFLERAVRTPEIEVRGVYSHLPFASQEGKAWALRRYSEFARLLDAAHQRDIHPPVTQVWGSSGLLAELPDVCNAVCVGHALFGLDPLERDVATPNALRPALLALTADIVRVSKPSTGDTSALDAGGYGGASGTTGTATVAIGLGDGLRKGVQGQPHILIGGQRAPIRAFTLEQLMVDLAEGAAADPLDRAIIIGGEGRARIPLEAWAEWTRSSPLEIMMSLSGNVPTVYRGAHSSTENVSPKDRGGEAP
jgi:alanine racemase